LITYCLDSNVYIQSHRFEYAHDIVPGYWNWLDHLVEEQCIISPSFVYKELTDNKADDFLSHWVKERKSSGLFLDPDSEIQIKFSEIADYVTRSFDTKNSEIFLQKADAWVISYADVHGFTVVTQEAPVGLGANKVKIPNICQVFGVNYVDTYTFLRRTGAQFH
jgi:hypothetical protein